MAGRTVAILIGVDGYAFAPLTSAVNDVLALRDELVAPGPGETPPLVAAEDITLLVSPAPGVTAPSGSRPATRRAILDALRAHYDADAPCERAIVYFAGHGMSASRDARVRESLVLPVDVDSPTDGDNMICLDDLLALFAERGPLQQLWLVDACRDMPYEERPRDYRISWNEKPPQTARAQVAIFAVSAGGKALSTQNGHGRFTGLVLSGLLGAGSAAEPLPGRGYCVTPKALHAYIERHVRESLQGLDDWTRIVMLPELRARGPAAEPLRDLPAPALQRFTVQIRPPEAATVIDVALEVQQGIPVPSWPPEAPPRPYELRAALRAGAEQMGWRPPKPPLRVVDLREEAEATIEVPRQPPPGSVPVTVGPLSAVTTGERGIARARATRAMRSPVPEHEWLGKLPAGPSQPTGTPVGKASLLVRAADDLAHVRLALAQHPWTVIERAAPGQALALDPGVWDVQILLGDEAISATRVLLSAGEHAEVSAVAQITPALAGLLPPHAVRPAEEAWPTVTPSESIGPMQGAVLPTLLPLLALKPFDRERQLLGQFDHLAIPLVSDVPIGPGAPPRWAAAIALDGPRTAAFTDTRGAGRVWQSPDRRTSIYIGAPGPMPGMVEIFLPGARLDVAAPGLPEGVTAISLARWPSGAMHLTVGLYRLPLGIAWPQPSGDRIEYPPGRLARALALAVPWFRAGADLRELRSGTLLEVAYAKWVDPVLGAIAFHALDQGRTRSGPDPEQSLRNVIRNNLQRFFGALPDCRIIGAAHDDEHARQAALVDLLDDATLGQPVLTASLALLAGAARQAGRHTHWALDRLARIAPGEVFNFVVTTH